VANYTLPSRNLTINGKAFWGAGVTAVMTYSIDGSENYTLPLGITPFFYRNPYVKISGSVVLPLLSAGDHSIAVYGKWTCRWADSAPNVPHVEIELTQVILNFTVWAPVITVFSPENTSYLSKDLPVNFTVDEPFSWVGYSLDNQNNVTFTENSTLTDLTFGNHTLAVYANDTAGVMGVSQTINFTVKAPSEPFSLLIFVAVTVTLAAVIAAIGIVVYRKHLNKT
jgi:flagellin-like protein